MYKETLGRIASSRQDTDYTGVGVGRSYDPRSATRGPVGLTEVFVKAALNAFVAKERSLEGLGA